VYLLAMLPRHRHSLMPLLNVLVLVLVLVFLSGIAAALASRSLTHPVRTYTPTELFSVVSQRPPSPLFHRGWTIQIRGTLEQARWLGNEDIYVLRDSVVPRSPRGVTGKSFALHAGTPNPFIAFLQRIPGLAAHLPPTADHPLLGHSATYRIVDVGCSSQCMGTHTPFRLLNGGS